MSARSDGSYVPGTLYPGTTRAVESAAECTVNAIIGAPPFLLFSVPFAIFDIGTSTVFDTAFLPFDLMLRARETEPVSRVTHYRGYCHVNWTL